MPQTLMNGHMNGLNGNETDNDVGSRSGTSYDMEDGQTFLFSSESVGEGHPGKFLNNNFGIKKKKETILVFEFCKINF